MSPDGLANFQKVAATVFIVHAVMTVFLSLGVMVFSPVLEWAGASHTSLARLFGTGLLAAAASSVAGVMLWTSPQDAKIMTAVATLTSLFFLWPILKPLITVVLTLRAFDAAVPPMAYLAFVYVLVLMVIASCVWLLRADEKTPS